MRKDIVQLRATNGEEQIPNNPINCETRRLSYVRIDESHNLSDCGDFALLR